jgi:hypothetical protein
MRPTALASLLLLAAACAPAQEEEPADAPALPVAATTAAPSPTPSATLPPLTKAETAYLAALRKSLPHRYSDESLNASYVDEGYLRCGSSPTFQSLRDVIDAGESEEWDATIRNLCPRHLPLWKKASTAITDGVYTVGEDFPAGTYRTTGGRVTRCYWERSTPGGDTIANEYINNAPKGVTVTVREGEGFTSRRCGTWVKV